MKELKKKVSLITTGGTIASKTIENGLLSSGALTGDELAALCQLPDDIEIRVINLLQLPSMHIDFGKMDYIRKAIEKELLDETVSGIVVTHGTDSLEETAYFLDLTINDPRPIVITGSQRSPHDVGTDVYSNLRNSIFVATDTILSDVGVVVVFNERIYSARYVKKVHASNLQGFESFGYGYLGIIDNDVVSVYQKPIIHETHQLIKEIPRVEIIKCYSGATGMFIDAATQHQVEGIVLEGVGRGQAAPSMVDSIQNALNKGMKIVVTTSAEEGKVYPAYSYLGSAHDLLERGVILGEDYDSKKARIKLAVLLASYEDIDPEYFKK